MSEVESFPETGPKEVSSWVVRVGHADDAVPCARIVNAWIDTTGWMPRVHSHADVERYYHDVVFQSRTVLVCGRPVAGFLALDDADCITALYCASTGRGMGRALLTQAKSRRDTLWLWTFARNTRAQSFYRREGFRETDRTDGSNEEGLPDIRYVWQRAAA